MSPFCLSCYCFDFWHLFCNKFSFSFLLCRCTVKAGGPDETNKSFIGSRIWCVAVSPQEQRCAAGAREAMWNLRETLAEVDVDMGGDDEYQSPDQEYQSQSPELEYQSQSPEQECEESAACSSSHEVSVRSSHCEGCEEQPGQPGQGAWGQSEEPLTEETFRKFCCGFACDLCRCDAVNYFNLPSDY
jgi:hypothetical protein